MKMYSSYIFVFLVLLGAVSVFFPHAYAQTTNADVGILPDSPFWGFKVFFENLQESFTFNDERRAELILEHAEVRRAEVDILERRMISIPEDVIINHDEKIARAQEIILRLEQGLPPRTPSSVSQLQIDQSEDRIGDVRLLQRIEDTDTRETIIDKLRDRLTLAFTDNQVIEIKRDFQDLQDEEDPLLRKMLADELDSEVNNPIVNLSCLAFIDTLSIADSPNPVATLQDQCLFLRSMPLDELRVFLDRTEESERLRDGN